MTRKEAEQLAIDCLAEVRRDCPPWVHPAMYAGVILGTHGLTAEEYKQVEEALQGAK